jgi:hypothetical protein
MRLLPGPLNSGAANADPRCRDHPPVRRVRGALAPSRRGRWQAWLTDDEPPELVFYCPECAEREFGPH